MNKVNMMNGIKNRQTLWSRQTKKLWFSPLSFFLLLVQLSVLFVPFAKVLAAQVTVDAAISTTTTEHPMMGASSVWVTDQVGYKFYVDSTGTCVYSKSSNGGTTWGTAVIIDSNTTCFGVVVWYDRWTPGDGGNYIHIVTTDITPSDDTWYNRLDTTNDERLMAVAPTSTILSNGQTPLLTLGANNASITKGTDGTLYVSMNDDTDSYVVQCSSDCGRPSSWTETGTNPMDNTANDFSLLMPLSGGDILLINRDISGDDMRSKVWDDSAGSWCVDHY
jgi:hypothetical protein